MIVSLSELKLLADRASRTYLGLLIKKTFSWAKKFIYIDLVCVMFIEIDLTKFVLLSNLFCYHEIKIK